VSFFRTIVGFAFAVAIVFPTVATSQGAPAPSPAELAAITARGRFVAEYDQAAWHGSDAAQAVAGKNTDGLAVFIGQKVASEWVVDFGALDAAGTSFLTVYEAKGPDTQHFTVQSFTPARVDSGFLVAAAHAIKITQANFEAAPGRTYNVAVMPNEDGTMYVYLYPAQTSAIVPLGGDGRFKVSADGLTILETHRMHRAIIEINPPSPPSGTHAVGMFHSDIYSSVPEDTDVFHVLASRPPMPEYVAAKGNWYLIDPDGTIHYKGPVPASVPGAHS
jgi:hypothetical protein